MHIHGTSLWVYTTRCEEEQWGGGAFRDAVECVCVCVCVWWRWTLK